MLFPLCWDSVAKKYISCCFFPLHYEQHLNAYLECSFDFFDITVSLKSDEVLNLTWNGRFIECHLVEEDNFNVALLYMCKRSLVKPCSLQLSTSFLFFLDTTAWIDISFNWKLKGSQRNPMAPHLWKAHWGLLNIKKQVTLLPTSLLHNKDPLAMQALLSHMKLNMD